MLEHAGRHRRYVRLIVPGETDAVEDVNEFARIYFIKAGFSPVFDKRYRVMMPWKTYIFDKSRIKSILRDEKPDMVEIGEKYTLSLMAGLMRKGIMNVSEKRPMLVHLSCERMDDNIASFISDGALAKRFSRGYIRNFVFPMFDFHLTNSKYTAAELLGAVSADDQSGKFLNFCWRLLRAAKVPVEERVFVNQCGVDHEIFSSSRASSEVRDRIHSENGFPAEAKVLLYAGRISPEKNIAVLPEVMKILGEDSKTDFRLLIAGSGPRAEWLRDEFAKSGRPQVRMLGNISGREELADLFANCDAFIHPNPKEPFGIAPLEAMASGVPLVAPNAGGLLSYANADNACLVDPTAEGFAEGIRSVFADAETTKTRVANAESTARRFSWQASIDNLFETYDRAHEEFLKNRELYDYNPASNIDFAADLQRRASQ
jgi:glycosyltransferase involved in cell wall biosynthesis